jgi:antirestriction protein ArdC
MPRKRTVRRYEDENHTTDGEKTMAISLHTQTSAPNTAAATSVSPLDPSGSSKTKFSQTRTDIYQTVTDNIIEALEAGVKPWVCPWQRVPGMSGLPTNYATGVAYSGMNIMLLWCSASELGFSDSRWMTYKQTKAEGAQVRKGEHGTTAIFYTTLEKENDEGGIEHIPMLKTFMVFNVEQIDGLPLVTEPGNSAETFEALPQAENLFRSSGANIIEKGQNAFFRPSTDEIWLPERRLFADDANFYATGLHELVHWSGARNRLNREMKGKFGCEDYAQEELVAELGSAFLMADLGIVGEVQHESYIASWLKALKNNKRYIFKAASAASKAHRYLMDKN